MLCPWPLLTVLVTATLATSAPLARRGGGSTDQSQQVSGTSDGSIHPISIDSSQTVENNFAPPPKIPSAVNNAPDPVGMAWVLGHMNQGQGAGGGGSDVSDSPSASVPPANQRREVPPIGAMIEPLMDGLGMAGMMGGMGGGGGGGSSGGGGGSADGSSQSSENADESYHPISVNSGQKVQNNFRRSPMLAAPARSSSAPPPPPSSSAAPPPPSSSAPPPPSSTPAPPPSTTPTPPSSSTSASAPSYPSEHVSDPHLYMGPGPVKLNASQLADHGPMFHMPPPRVGTTIPNSGASLDGQSQSDGDGDGGDDSSGSGGKGAQLGNGQLSGHAKQIYNHSGNDQSSNVSGVSGGAVFSGAGERVCYLPSYEGNVTSYTTDSVYNTNVNNSQNATQTSKGDQQQAVTGFQDQHKSDKSGGQQNGGKGNRQSSRRAVFARGNGHGGGGGSGGGGKCGNCVCNCDCSPNRRSVNVTPSSLYSLYERRGGTKKVVTPANCAVVKSQGGLVYSGDQCHLKGQPAKVSG